MLADYGGKIFVEKVSFEPGTNSECVMEGKKSQTNIISHKNAQRTTFLAFFRSRSKERKFQGAKVPGSESSTHGTFVPGSEWSWERKVQLPP